MKTIEVTLQVKAITFDVKGFSPVLATPKTWSLDEERAFRYELRDATGNDYHSAVLLTDSCCDDKAEWYLIYNEDCCYPPLAVVRADDVETAIDIVADGCAWFRLEGQSEADTEEMTEKGLWNFSSNGYMYDAETLVVRTAKPVAVHF